MRTSTKTRTSLAEINQDRTVTTSASQARAAATPDRGRGRAVVINPTRTKATPARGTWITRTTVKGNPSAPAPRGIPEISYQRTAPTMF